MSQLSALLCTAASRRWAQYVFTSRRVIVKNGCAGRAIQAVTLDDIAEITVQQEPVARFFDLRLGLSGFPGETESSYCTESAIPKYSRRVSTPSGCRSEPGRRVV
ncbi:PH domain-containing protein [Nitrospira calida]